MAYELLKIEGNVLHAKITGIMSLADQQALQKAGGKLIEQNGSVRMLVALQNFKGWEKGADWGDVEFMLGQGKKITKMAIVGDKRWEEDTLVFVGKGLRPTEIEFFAPSALKEADSWISS